MFRPAIQKLRTLILMSVFCVTMAFISMFFKTIEYKKGYTYKVEAREVMSGALSQLKIEAKEIYSKKSSTALVNDETLDPLNSGLIFYCDDSDGRLSSKLSTLNPNFSALIVDLFIQSGLAEGDNIAVAFTGSMPGANIAVLSACKAMGIKPTIISSLSASNWGACDYDRFSWYDMEEELMLFFKSQEYKSIAYSIGKGGDIGSSLPKKTIDIINKKIFPSSLNISNSTRNLTYHVDKRINKYLGYNNSDIKLYVNVGGGVASLGTYPGIKERVGYLTVDSLKILKESKQLNGNSVMAKMALEHGIPAVNIVDIEQLINGKLNLIDIGLNDDSSMDSKLGYVEEERLFSQRKYNLVIVIPCLILSLALVLSIGLYSHFQIKKRMSSYEPDAIS